MLEVVSKPASRKTIDWPVIWPVVRAGNSPGDQGDGGRDDSGDIAGRNDPLYDHNVDDDELYLLHVVSSAQSTGQ